MKIAKSLRASLAIMLLNTAATVIAPAADHIDSPLVAQDPGADIADVFAFLDPTDITKTVLIATVHPYIIPGQMNHAAFFDDSIRYRFEIYNDHVNVASPILDDAASTAVKKAYIKRVVPKLFIDVTFSKPIVGPEQQANNTGNDFIPDNLRRAKTQTASVVLTGFKDLDGKPLFKGGKYPAPGAPLITTTPHNVSFTNPAPNFVVNDIVVGSGQSIQFFAGVVDDPFFFDLPAFTAFVDGLRNGTGPTVSAFFRQRDTFAGYNVLAIAVRIPTVLFKGTNGPKIGVDFLTQRHGIEHFTAKGFSASGTFATVDRAGAPFVNSLFVPFDSHDRYNASSPKDDTSLIWADDIVETLSEFGMDVDTPEPAFSLLASYFIEKGDMLVLDTSISNFGEPAGAGYPNGRRLKDDTVDIILTTINHGMTVGDGVANSGSLTTLFPFLGKPNQPLPNGATDPTQN